MSLFDEAVLNTVMPRVQAWELLNDPEYSSRLRMVDFYNLMITAGYTRDEAQKAANVRGFERLKSGMII